MPEVKLSFHGTLRIQQVQALLQDQVFQYCAESLYLPSITQTSPLSLWYVTETAMFITCLKKKPVCRYFSISLFCWPILSAIPLAQATTPQAPTLRLHEWVIFEEALPDFVEIIRRQKEHSIGQYVSRGTLHFPTCTLSAPVLLTLSFLGSRAELFSAAVSRMFRVRSTLTHLSFHTTLVF